MELQPFDVNETAPFYEAYYGAQAGDGLSVFAGKRHIEGDGLGSMLGGLFKAVAPALKSVGKSALKSIGRGAIGVAKDVLAGKDFKESAIDGLNEAGEEILDSTLDNIPSRKRKAPNRRKRNRNKKTPFHSVEPI